MLVLALARWWWWWWWYTVSSLRYTQACMRAGVQVSREGGGSEVRLGARQVLIYRLTGRSRWRLWSLWWRASVIIDQGPSSLDWEPV